MEGKDLLAEFDMEMENTRRALDRLPEDRLDFRPHAKSWDLRQLAGHIANLPSWTAPTLQLDELDLGQPMDQPDPGSKADVLALYERTKVEARAALERATEDDFATPWTLRTGDQVHFTMPKGVVLRQFIMNHLVHHRGQLILYLRLLDVPVPGLYGPSADETEM